MQVQLALNTLLRCLRKDRMGLLGLETSPLPLLNFSIQQQSQAIYLSELLMTVRTSVHQYDTFFFSGIKLFFTSLNRCRISSTRQNRMKKKKRRRKNILEVRLSLFLCSFSRERAEPGNRSPSLSLHHSLSTLKGTERTKYRQTETGCLPVQGPTKR